MPGTILRLLHTSAGFVGSAALWCSAVSAAPIPAGPAAAEPLQSEQDVAAEPGSAQAEPAVSSDQSVTDEQIWRGNVELYMFAPLKLDSTTTIRGRETDASLDLGDILSALEWATAVRASVEQGRIGVLTDLSYTRLGDEAATTAAGGVFTGKADVGIIQGLYDFAVRYRFGEPEAAVGKAGQFNVIPYVGVRVIDLQLDVDAQIRKAGTTVFAGQGSLDRTWAQPLVGAQASVFLAPRLRAFARADIGGFGITGSRDLSGNAQVGLGYAIGNNTNINLSWRYLGIDYNNGKSPANAIDMTENGVQLGVQYFF
jgi:hypothetical protein